MTPLTVERIEMARLALKGGGFAYADELADAALLGLKADAELLLNAARRHGHNMTNVEILALPELQGLKEAEPQEPTQAMVEAVYRNHFDAGGSDGKRRDHMKLCRAICKTVLAATPHRAGQIPDVLFDGYAVLNALTPGERSYTSPENVSAVLTAVVRVLRRALAQEEGKPCMSNDGCPCLYVKPCMDSCSCANSSLSGGCLRCAKYGSREQQIAGATHIAAILDAALRAAPTSAPDLAEAPTLPFNPTWQMQEAGGEVLCVTYQDGIGHDLPVMKIAEAVWMSMYRVAVPNPYALPASSAKRGDE